MTDLDLLRLHRELIAHPSLSGQEGALSAFLEDGLRAQNLPVQRVGANLIVALSGPDAGPVLCLNSHLDTVPVAPGWTRPPHEATVEEGRVYGLGSNDAKGSVAAMVAAFVRLRERPLPLRLVLTLAVEEETTGKGTAALLSELAAQNLSPEAAVVGEPTGLDIAIAQKGLLIVELRSRGRACHAAHARELDAPNALRILARDMEALGRADLGPDHPLLGPVTCEPTVVSGGTARNMIPAEASCVHDLRTNPGEEPRDLAARLRAAIGPGSELRILSERLRPRQTSADSVLVEAARQARPGARLYGSRTLSDLVFFEGIPAIKVGPGSSERSHTPDEYLLETELLEGALFYENLVLAYAAARGERR